MFQLQQSAVASAGCLRTAPARPLCRLWIARLHTHPSVPASAPSFGRGAPHADVCDIQDSLCLAKDYSKEGLEVLERRLPCPAVHELVECLKVSAAASGAQCVDARGSRLQGCLSCELPGWASTVSPADGSLVRRSWRGGSQSHCRATQSCHLVPTASQRTRGRRAMPHVKAPCAAAARRPIPGLSCTWPWSTACPTWGWTAS